MNLPKETINKLTHHDKPKHVTSSTTAITQLTIQTQPNSLHMNKNNFQTL